MTTLLQKAADLPAATKIFFALLIFLALFFSEGGHIPLFHAISAIVHGQWLSLAAGGGR